MWIFFRIIAGVFALGVISSKVECNAENSELLLFFSLLFIQTSIIVYKVADPRKLDVRKK